VSTRPLGPPAFIPDDPGPWAVTSHTNHIASRPGRRRPIPPSGLMLSPPPSLDLPIVGIADQADLAAAGPIRVIAAAREPAHGLWFDAEGDVLRGVSPYVKRAWSLPDLALALEERPGDDPAADLPPIEHGIVLAESLPPVIAEAPGGSLVAVTVRENRYTVVAVVRPDDRKIVRWIRGARAAAWSADGKLFAIGGDWGVLLAAPLVTPDAS
jgi:hypothetical protein